MCEDMERLGRAVSGKRILWLDPGHTVDVDEVVVRRLEEAAMTVSNHVLVMRVAEVDEALTAIAERPWDLVITHWGHQMSNGHPSVGVHLLCKVRVMDTRPPVIVFASGDHADSNKAVALRRGAVAYAYRWETLFRVVAEVLGSGTETG